MSVPILFVKNIGKSTVSCSGTSFGVLATLEVEPGKIEELPYWVAATAEFQRVWAANNVEVSATYDFAVKLTSLPAVTDTAAWNDISGKPAVIAAGATQAAARTAIGAGTSNLAVGSTATDAKAGNYTPPNASTSVKGLVNQAATQANFAGADAGAIVIELNAFLAKLKTAGIVA